MDAIKQRYMLDTSAINFMVDNTDYFTAMLSAASDGAEYFLTEIQCDEIKRTIGTGNIVERSRASRALKLMDISVRLRPQFMSRIATLYLNKWILDGTYGILPDGETDTVTMFRDILNNNLDQHYDDAMIAMVSIANGCVLVTQDKRLHNKVNKHFPGRAVHCNHFLHSI